MKKNYKVRFYYDNFPSKGEKADRKTKTVPDLSYSVQEIIDRFSRNQVGDLDYHDPVYSENEDFDQEDMEELKRADLTDKWQKYEELDELRKEAINLSRQKAKEKSVKIITQEEVIKEAKQNPEDETK